MYYYLVWVRSSRYHGSEPLTYSSDKRLETGTIVKVEMQKELILGAVSGPTGQPRFKTKPIREAYDLPPLPAHLFRVSQWLMQYYPAPLGIIAQQLLPGNLTAKQMNNVPPLTFTEPKLDDLPPLTKQQTAALEAMQERDTYLLHGRTGSGKTRLYIELAARTIARGYSCIILTPEISLTSQLAANLRSVFGERVLVQHSQQTPVERQQAWLQALTASEPVIIVGPRSALFSPIAKPGLIVLDEAHEAAYKQEQAPQYQTARVAGYLAQQTRATVVLGSATPSVSDYFVALEKKKPIIELTESARDVSQHATSVQIIDMKERTAFSRSQLLSQPLIQAVEQALSRGEQSLLYLNRRGTARLVMCEHCGWQAACPHCDLPLTYHGDRHELRCHSCDYHQSTPASCPACGQPSILFRTAGTKAIVSEVEKLFPQARVARFDTDNNKAERFEQHYETAVNGEIDILVGTQLLAKGLDLPRLSTLGIVLADTSLYMPDFSAQERTYQLLTQVLGRVGRGHLEGHAVIQTYHPDHPVLAAALKNDYAAFYASELALRKQYYFPPYVYLLKLTCRRSTAAAAEASAEKLKTQLQTSGLQVRIEGPAPSFYEKIQQKYQWQLVVKAVQRSELLKIVADLPANWSYDIDPLDLL